MSDVVGRGVIELSADSSGLNAAIDKARKSIKGLGEEGAKGSANSSKSIDAYIKKLSQQRDMLGMNTREMEAYKLAAKGASDAQLRAAAAHGKAIDQFKRGEEIGDRIKSSFLAFGAIAATSMIAATVAIDNLIKKAGDFQDMAEKVGDTAENIASLSVAAGTAGVAMDTIVSASTKLTKGLTGVEDETKAAGAAIKALGLNLEEFKNLRAADQLEAVAKALDDFEDGAEKTAVAMALFGKSGADLLPFLKTLSEEGGRQVILTEKQIQLADEYADKQARLGAEISLYAQAIATEAAPALTNFMQAIADLARDQEIAAAATDVLKGAIQGGIVIFQTIAVVAANVGFVFAGVYREVVALKNQLVALATLDFAKFNAISEAVKADGERALATLTRFEQRVMSIGQGQDPANYSNELRGKPAAPEESKPKKKLNFSGAAGKEKGGADKVNQEAKAQLARDLADIKRAADAEVNIYANAEKILEAKRAANLVDDAKYYAEKLAFLQLNSQAREAETIKEIERLQREKLSGNDKLENDRKITDEQAKLAKIRADAAANVDVMGIQEAAAAQKIVNAYADAKAAAQAYLDTVRNQNARELEGIGRGDKFRQQQAARNEIEDRYTGQRQGLERDLRRGQITREQFDTYLSIVKETYQAEAIEYELRTERINAAQRDWTVGATAALENYYDESRNVADQVGAAFINAFDGLEDALVKFTQTGKLDFKSLISSINADIARIAIKESITGPLAGWLKGQIGGMGGMFGGQPVASAAGAVADAAGNSAKIAAEAAQTAAITASTAALTGQAAAVAASTAAETAASAAIATASATSSAALTAMSAAASAAAAALSTVAASSAASAASGSGSAIANIASAVSGGRAIGGPVSAGGLYEVNEKGRPELLNVAGKQYLMMGGQGGSVDANPQMGGGGTTVHQTIQFMNNGPIDRRTQAQLASAAYQGGQRAAARIG